jgi:hypothetical protein
MVRDPYFLSRVTLANSVVATTVGGESSFLKWRTCSEFRDKTHTRTKNTHMCLLCSCDFFRVNNPRFKLPKPLKSVCAHIIL